MMKMIKWDARLAWGTLAFLFLLLFSKMPGLSDSPKIEVIAYQSKIGWGYQLVKDEQVLIHQPFIPAIAKEIGFASQKDALKVGYYVRKKLYQGKSPTISVKEIESLCISLDRLIP